MKLDDCTALITGASAGIGREFARQLAGRAGSLVLVARRRDRLEELRRELTSSHSNLRVHVHSFDLAQTDQVERLCAALEQDGIGIDLLINNAGLGDRGDFVGAEPQRILDMLLVNVVALTALTRRLLPGMIARKKGAVLNVSSCASFLPMATMAVYAATKAYVTSFSEAIGAELRGTGIHVTALCPGPVHTEFASVAARGADVDQQIAPGFTHVPVGDVVRDGIRGVEAARPIVIPGFVMKLGMLLVRLTPMPVLRLASRVAT
ncbi:MAG: SDR family oxidoreductase [Verrucomicrobiota bacterium]|nr:SDR family oxidoreductase [Verrucomicrobiota bacterium]